MISMSIINKLDNNTHMIDAYYAYPGHSCVYLVGDEDEYALIDCGTALSGKYIMGALENLNIDPGQIKYILPTHVHLDHAGGAGVLCQTLPNAQVYVHPRGHRHLINPERLVSGSVIIYGEDMMKFAVGDTIPVPEDRCHELEDGQELSVGKLKILTQFTPGHAKHHCGFFEEKNGNYYSGDVLGNSYPFMDSKNRHLMFLCSAPVDYNGGDWHDSLNKISALSPKRACLCHCGALNNPGQAIEDMHRLIDKNDALAVKLVDIDDDGERRKAVEEMVWGLFWDEFEERETPMNREHAKSWMKKDVHISTEGIDHWLKTKRLEQKG